MRSTRGPGREGAARTSFFFCPPLLHRPRAASLVLNRGARSWINLRARDDQGRFPLTPGPFPPAGLTAGHISPERVKRRVSVIQEILERFGKRLE